MPGQSTPPPLPLDATQWLTIMGNCLDYGWERQYEDKLKSTLASLHGSDLDQAMTALSAACLSEDFRTLGHAVEPKKSTEYLRNFRRTFLVTAGTALLTQGTSKELWQAGLDLVENAKRILTHGGLSHDRKRKLRTASVNTGNTYVAKRCATLLGDDLHMYFQEACELGKDEIIQDLAPNQAKRHNNLSLQRAIREQNLDLTRRLLPHCVPKKSCSLVLGVAAENIVDLEGLGTFGFVTRRMKDMPDTEKRQRLETAHAILKLVAECTDAADILALDSGKNIKADAVRRRELLLLHATDKQWQRAARNTALRAVVPELDAWHKKGKLRAMGRSKEPRKPTHTRSM